MVSYTCNPNVLEAEAGGSGVWGQPDQHSSRPARATQKKPCLKKQTQKNANIYKSKSFHL